MRRGGPGAAEVPAPYRVRARNLAVDSDNKIHDDAVAARFGFTGGLVPGVELFAYAAHPLVAAWGEDVLRGGRLQLRFRRPVYDGDEVVVSAEPAAAGATALRLDTGGDAPRSVGTAWRHDPAGQRQDYRPHPLRASLLATHGELPVGPLGSVTQDVDPAGHADYLDGIGETLPLFRDEGVVHPGALLRMVNDVLMQNVALGPWIHTASDCRFLAVGRVPARYACHGVVTGCFERNGNAYVRYDALVTADGEPVNEVDHTAIYRLAGGD